MNLARSLHLINPRSVTQRLIRSYSISSANIESSTTKQPEVQEKFDFENIKVIERDERRKPPIDPFMKNVMLSVFDRNLLAYPEILNKDETTELEERINNINKVFSNVENTSKERKNALIQTDMFGAPVRLTAGGLAMNVTERLRYLETMSSDIHLSKELSDHWVGLNVVLNGVSEEILSNLIPKLISGDHTISLCCKEIVPTRINQPDFKTFAQLDKNDVWRINGHKICSNASGYLLVLCKVDAMQINAFLVEPHAEGVSYTSPSVHFRDTPAIPLNKMSEEKLTSFLGISRLDTAVLNYSLLKHAMMHVVKYVRGKYTGGKPLAESKLIQAKLGECLTHVYAAESMTYFTAGLLDGYYEPDADLEMAMCRAFTTKYGMNKLMDLLSIPGLEGIEDDWTSFLDYYRKLNVQDEMLDNVYMYIGLSSLQFVGQKLAQEVQQLRNPLFHPGYVFKKIWANRNQVSDTPKLDLYLADHLHPVLKTHAQSLEYCVLRLRYACETILTRHGAEVTQALTEVERLAQAGTDVFAMTAALSRASRSYCIGVRNAEMEMKIAPTFVCGTREVVKKTIIDLIDGEYINQDHFKINIGKKILDSNTLIVEKPIERVFW